MTFSKCYSEVLATESHGENFCINVMWELMLALIWIQPSVLDRVQIGLHSFEICICFCFSYMTQVPHLFFLCVLYLHSACKSCTHTTILDEVYGYNYLVYVFCNNISDTHPNPLHRFKTSFLSSVQMSFLILFSHSHLLAHQRGVVFK